MKKFDFKRCYTIIAIAALILLYIGIFLLSSEVAEASSDKSSAVTRFLLKLYYAVTSGNGAADGVVYVDTFPLELEKLVRKAAHFSEYFSVGFLSYSLVLLWHGRWKRGRTIVLSQLVLSAVLDELHQYFVPGRYASVKDVLLDSVGGIFGMLAVFGFFVWRKKRRARKAGESFATV